jgi:glycerophosphoryl diester phosphodiesterase
VSHEPWLNAAICSAPAGPGLTPEAGQAFSLYQHDYADIRSFDCGSQRHPGFPEQQPSPAYKPRLHEVFEAVAARCAELKRPLPSYSIELKSFVGGDDIYHPAPAEFVAMVSAVVAADRALLGEETPLLMSFDHRVVAAARQQSGLPVCLLIEDQLPLANHLQQLGFIPDILGPDFGLLSMGLLEACAALHLPIITWTVNQPQDLVTVAAMGVHGITTDYPDRAAALLH